MRRPLALALLLAALAAPPAAASSLVEVPLSGPRSVAVLERAGLDVTHDVSARTARVVLHSGADARALARAGFTARTIVADAEKALRSAPRARAAARSALPSGRDSYRVLSDYVAELDALAQQHPGLVRRIALPGRSIEGREIAGIEIARDVNRADDGRPVYAMFGLHHAREWPSGEVNMEFALDLARGYGRDPRITGLLDRLRVVIVPVVNPDGFVVSRGQDPLQPAGPVPLHRRNCRATTPEEEGAPCSQREGVDLNRNYGAGWGGPGASASRTSDSYRGAGPFSEPESQAVHAFSQGRQIMHVQSTHNIVGQVLRQPGFRDYGPVTPDEGIMKPLGDRMADATGYDSLLGYELYDVHGATEDWNYIAQGAMGYTIELGPPDTPGSSPVGAGTAPLFQGPYQTHVVDQYLGGGTGGPSGHGMREALLLGAEQAADARDHGVLEGAARPGATLRVRRDFQTMTVRRCPDTGDCDDSARLPEIGFDDVVETTLTVPASGRFSWHVGPSTRPWIGASGGSEPWVLTCESPSAGAVLARRSLTVARGQVLTFADACDPGAAVTSTAAAPSRPPRRLRPPRGTRLVVGRRRVRRSTLRRRGHARIALRLRGTTLRRLRLILLDRDRDVRASRRLRRLRRGRTVVRLALRPAPPRGRYRLRVRGIAPNGASVGAAARFTVLRG